MKDANHDELGHRSPSASRPRAQRAPARRRSEVVYTFKVLNPEPVGGQRTVLFRRVGDGEAIEIRTETDAPNLLAQLPDFLEAAIEARRLPSLKPSDGELTARLAEEAARLRFLAHGLRG